MLYIKKRRTTTALLIFYAILYIIYPLCNYLVVTTSLRISPLLSLLFLLSLLLPFYNVFESIYEKYASIKADNN